MTLSSANTPGHIEPGRHDNEEVLHIPQSSSVIGTSPSHYLVSYQDTHSGGSSPSTEVQSVYYAVPADWSTITVSVM